MGLLGLDPPCRLGPAPLSPAIIVLLHGPGSYPTLGGKDADGGGDAVEDGTHLPVPGTPNVLGVPGAAPATPRYGSAQASSPAPRGSHPSDHAGTGKCTQPDGATPFGQIWTASQGDIFSFYLIDMHSTSYVSPGLLPIVGDTV